MGQYHSIYNKTKKEYFSIGGAKLWEKVGDAHAAAFLLLLSNSNGRGGGDFYIPQEFNSKKMESIPLKGHAKAKQDAINLVSGRWAGDSIVVQGDYVEESDPGFISAAELEGYKSITQEVFNALEALFEDDEAVNKALAFEAKFSGLKSIKPKKKGAKS